MPDEATIIMEENLNLVWNERDPALRLKAIQRIYCTTAKRRPSHFQRQQSAGRSLAGKLRFRKTDLSL